MANHYVREGAGGSADGSDWTNAWVTLPAALTRGDTYYIADGTYTGYDFDDALDGTTYIYIKKATAADHGTETGWDSAYGDGQAAFARAGDSVWVVLRGYYVFDGGGGGGPSAWTTGHGFCLSKPNAGHLIDLRGPDWYRDPLPDYLDFSHIELYGGGQDGELAINGIYHQSQTGNPINTKFGPANVTISYCYLHEFGVASWPINTYQCTNWLYEYNYMTKNTSTELSHSEGWQDKGSDDMVVRFNRFDEIEGTAVIALKRNDKMTNVRWGVYGNLFWYPADYARSGVGGQGVFGDARGDDQVHLDDWDDFTCTDCLFYNNTIVRMPDLNSGLFFPIGSGNVAYNNIWYNCYLSGTSTPNVAFTSIENEVTHNYNIYINSLAATQTPGANDIESEDDVFINIATCDLHLSGATVAGMTLSTPYNTDLDGETRGADGTWDRGAYEYDSGVNPWVMIYG